MNASRPVAQIQPFACTVPAGTPIAAPVTIPMALLPLDIVWVEFIVPPGPRGEVGFYIGSHGQPIIPYGSGATPWIVTDDEKTHWELEDQPDSGDWSLTAYNIGVLPHTVYVRWGLAAPTDLAPVLPAPIPLAILSGSVPGA